MRMSPLSRMPSTCKCTNRIWCNLCRSWTNRGFTQDQERRLNTHQSLHLMVTVASTVCSLGRMVLTKTDEVASRYPTQTCTHGRRTCQANACQPDALYRQKEIYRCPIACGGATLSVFRGMTSNSTVQKGQNCSPPSVYVHVPASVRYTLSQGPAEAHC
jgi:hypothetical protein